MKSHRIPQTGLSDPNPVPPITPPEKPFRKNLRDTWFKALVDLIDNERIDTVFQPLFDLKTGKIHGCEALSRIKGSTPFSGPEHLFDIARQFRLTARLERLCRKKALLNAHHRRIRLPINLNVCPSVLKCPDHKKGVTASLAEELLLVRDHIILELTEKHYIRDHQLFSKTVDYYRNQGFRIAIDDLGSGYAGLKLLRHIKPFMVKIDRILISGIDASPTGRALIESLVSFCHKIDAIVVAEGIEREEELDVLMELNVDLGQGYLLAHPQSYMDGNRKPEPLQCRLDNRCPPAWEAQTTISNCVESLARHEAPADSNKSVAGIVDRFRGNESLFCIPVVENGRPVGIVHKSRLFYRLGQRYGYDLFFKKPVKVVMEPALVFETGTLLEDVSHKVLNREEGNIYDAIIVSRNGRYHGIVKIHHLLERITRQKVRLARQANPLTGLPGNQRIRKEILHRLSVYSGFSVMYFDLDHFKPYNDRFGFQQGDRVIRLLADLLQEEMERFDTDAFVGHIGGDDFIAVCRSSRIEDLCNLLLHEFDRRVRKFMDPETVKNGFYIGIDRQGKTVQIPLLSLSIAVVTCENMDTRSYDQLISIASEVKKQAKHQPGSSYTLFPINSFTHKGACMNTKTVPATRVLIVCVHNSARSQMAEVFINSLGQGRLIAESAGLEPGTMNPLVVEVMKEKGYDLSTNASHSVFEFFKEGRLYDYVITVCDESEAKCPVFPGIRKRLFWPFPDPEEATGTHEEKLEHVRKIRDAIEEAISSWVNNLLQNG